MVVHISPSGPDPARVNTLEDLIRELGLLRARAARGTRAARVSLDELAGRVHEPKSTVHAYLSGKRLAPAQMLDRLVIALGTSADEQREWAEAWYRVSASRESAQRTSAQRVRPVAEPARGAVPRQLPMAIEGFTGRADDLLELDALLSGTSVMAAVTGAAGIGKTALAVHWAQTRGTNFADGQLYVDLGGFGPDEPLLPGQALARFLRAMGVAGADIPAEPDERAALYRSLISGRRMLVVLDNAADSEQVRALLPGSSSCSVLVTSRDSLTGLIVRHGAHRLRLDALTEAEAVQLLSALIDPPAPLTARGLAAVAQACGRLPLALRIAAVLAGSHPGDLVRELAESDGTRRLDLLEADDDRRTAIRAVFGWSYRRLPAEVGSAFRLIGRLPEGELTPAALAALTGTDLTRALRSLDVLTRFHLVEQGRNGLYELNPLLRDYAGELAVAGETEVDRRRALARFGERADRELPDRDWDIAL